MLEPPAILVAIAAHPLEALALGSLFVLLLVRVIADLSKIDWRD